MRHQKTTKKLGRKSAPRKALMRSLCNSLVLHGSITTTLTKAKTIRPIIEKLVTKAKKGDLHSRRAVLRYLTEKNTRKLFSEIANNYKERKGGYTRIIKLDRRAGDNSETAIIEFV